MYFSNYSLLANIGNQDGEDMVSPSLTLGWPRFESEVKKNECNISDLSVLKSS